MDLFTLFGRKRTTSAEKFIERASEANERMILAKKTGKQKAQERADEMAKQRKQGSSSPVGGFRKSFGAFQDFAREFTKNQEKRSLQQPSIFGGPLTPLGGPAVRPLRPPQRRRTAVPIPRRRQRRRRR